MRCIKAWTIAEGGVGDDVRSMTRLTRMSVSAISHSFAHPSLISGTAQSGIVGTTSRLGFSVSHSTTTLGANHTLHVTILISKQLGL